MFDGVDHNSFLELVDLLVVVWLLGVRLVTLVEELMVATSVATVRARAYRHIEPIDLSLADVT